MSGRDTEDRALEKVPLNYTNFGKLPLEKLSLWKEPNDLKSVLIQNG